MMLGVGDDWYLRARNGKAASRRTLMMGALCLAALLPRHSQAADRTLARTLGDDTFMTGGQLHIEREIRGDAVLAGGSISVRAPVRGDGVFAGGELDLAGPFGEDVYAAGGQIRVTGEIAGNGRFAGGTVTFGPDSHVRGGVSVAAGRAEVAGDVAEYLQVTAGSTRLLGRVAGDMDVSGGELDIGPSAVIDGDLVFRGPRAPHLAPGALVRGQVRHIQAGGSDGGERWLGLALSSLMVCLGAAVVAALAWALWPGFTRAVEDVARRRTATALLAGAAVVVGAPLAMALLFVSIVGIPLALLVLVLYLMLFPLGYLAACASATDGLLERLGVRSGALWVKRLATLVLVLFGLSLIALIPFLGWTVLFVVTVLGMGAILLASIDAHRGRKSRASEPARSEWDKLRQENAPASA